jgi:cytochrome bd-type quinol oxidase subunit 1
MRLKHVLFWAFTIGLALIVVSLFGTVYKRAEEQRETIYGGGF